MSLHQTTSAPCSTTTIKTGFVRGILHNRCNILIDSGRGSSKQDRRMDAEIRAYKECPIVFQAYDIQWKPEHLEDVLGSR